MPENSHSTLVAPKRWVDFIAMITAKPGLERKLLRKFIIYFLLKHPPMVKPNLRSIDCSFQVDASARVRLLSRAIIIASIRLLPPIVAALCSTLTTLANNGTPSAELMPNPHQAATRLRWKNSPTAAFCYLAECLAADILISTIMLTLPTARANGAM